MKPRRDVQGPFGVRVGIWLFVFGVGLIGIFSLVPSRPVDTRVATVYRPEHSYSSTPRARRVPVSVSEPIYQGRRLSDWAEDLRTGNSKTRATAQDALVAIGPQAIPALAELLSDTEASNAAAFALERFGKEALPVLLDALASGTTLAKLSVTGVIGRFSSDYSNEVVPALVQCMRDEDAGLRMNAIAALQSMPQRADIAVPALTICLSDSDAAVRGNAATVIGKFGHDAESAIPELTRIVAHDADSYVSSRASDSLRLIAPAIDVK